MNDPLWRVAWDLDGIPRVDGRVVLNTGPLHVACEVCDVRPGELCDLEATPGPGIPVMFHHGRVLKARSDGHPNDCTDSRKFAMKRDADLVGERGIGESLGAIGWLKGREKVYDPEGKVDALRKELEESNDV